MKNVKAKKIIMLLIKLLLISVMTFNVVIAALTFLEYNTDLDLLPYSALAVKGGSMSPEYSAGDLVIVRKLDYRSLGVGDDVTFLTTEGLVTHRIVEIRDGEYITRGLANNTDDLYSMDMQTYCGRVVLDIPYMGYAALFVGSSAIVLAAAMLIVIAACFARPIIEKLREKQDETVAKGSCSLPTRLLTCLSVFSLFLSLPYVTDTKYIGELNKFDTIVSKSLYFSSNYLSDGDGNTYSVNGWSGTKDNSLVMQIKNHSNGLLFNEEGQDISYKLGVKIHGADGYETAYSITLEQKITNTETETGTETESSEGSSAQPISETFTYPADGDGTVDLPSKNQYVIKGGSTVTDEFSVTITPLNADGTENKDGMGVGKKIAFEIYAVTEENTTYSVMLHAKFIYHVAQSNSFIGTTTFDDLSSMVNISVATNQISGANEKLVAFKWDPSKLYLNEYQSTVFNIINDDNYQGYYKEDEGILYMRLQSFSLVKLEFFKIGSFTADEQDILIQVVESITEVPTAPPVEEEITEAVE